MIIYVVKSGDTLSKISREFNVPVDKIVLNNGMPNPNQLVVGQSLVLVPMLGEVMASNSTPAGFVHTVAPGESMHGIAQRYGVTLASIIEANPQISLPTLIYPGTAVNIPDGSMQQNRVYSVLPGDSFYSIAKRYGTTLPRLIEANPQIPMPNMIYPGMEMIIPSPIARVSALNEAVAAQGSDKWGKFIVNGYCYPSISAGVLLECMPFLSYMSIFAYKATPTGDLIKLNDQTLINTVRARNIAPMLVLTNISPEGGFSSDIASTILNSAELSETLLNNVVGEMKAKKYHGLDLDFEYVYPRDREAYNQFLLKARAKMDANGFELTTALAPKYSDTQTGLLYEAHDYAFHGKVCDHVIIMTYEWGYQGGPPMAIAPLNNVKRVMDFAVTQIPPEKLLMGIPNYSYDWTLPYEKGTYAKVLTNTAAVSLAFNVGAAIEFDKVAASPYFNYRDSAGKEHIVWFEDARSIYAKMELVRNLGLAGVSYWTVNSSFMQNWTIIRELWNVTKVI